MNSVLYLLVAVCLCVIAGCGRGRMASSPADAVGSVAVNPDGVREKGPEFEHRVGRMVDRVLNGPPVVAADVVLEVGPPDFVSAVGVVPRMWLYLYGPSDARCGMTVEFVGDETMTVETFGFNAAALLTDDPRWWVRSTSTVTSAGN